MQINFWHKHRVLWKQLALFFTDCKCKFSSETNPHLCVLPGRMLTAQHHAAIRAATLNSQMSLRQFLKPPLREYFICAVVIWVSLCHPVCADALLNRQYQNTPLHVCTYTVHTVTLALCHFISFWISVQIRQGQMPRLEWCFLEAEASRWQMWLYPAGKTELELWV